MGRPDRIKAHRVFLCAGSNMGDKAENCRKGILALSCVPGTVLEMQSCLYRTEPVDFEDQDWFVNMMAQIETDMEPHALLAVLKEIERRAGRRVDGIRFGPRVLDLDIIFYDDAVIETGKLAIPHPRMHRRRFVLKPMCDIAPGFVHPVLKKTMEELLDALEETGKKETGQKVIPYP